MFSEPADEARSIGDEGLLEILETALADERAAQARVPAAVATAASIRRPAPSSTSCSTTSRRTSAPCSTRHTEVKKRLGLSGTAQRDA